MAKEKESQPDQPAPPVVPVIAPPKHLPTVGEIVAAIKTAGQSLTQVEREEIIRTVALLVAPANQTKPSPYDGIMSFNFHVTYGELSLEVVAKSDREAWALACDTWKEWPGPKRGKVECLGPVAETAA